jgi:hypothetical protein
LLWDCFSWIIVREQGGDRKVCAAWRRKEGVCNWTRTTRNGYKTIENLKRLLENVLLEKGDYGIGLAVLFTAPLS